MGKKKKQKTQSKKIKLFNKSDKKNTRAFAQQGPAALSH